MLITTRRRSKEIARDEKGKKRSIKEGEAQELVSIPINGIS